jgi:hypothetical protein
MTIRKGEEVAVVGAVALVCPAVGEYYVTRELPVVCRSAVRSASVAAQLGYM